MTQVELERAVAQATGETPREIRRRGFGIVSDVVPAFDLDSSNRLPQFIDWDERDAQRVAIFP